MVVMRAALRTTESEGDERDEEMEGIALQAARYPRLQQAIARAADGVEEGAYDDMTEGIFRMLEEDATDNCLAALRWQQVRRALQLSRIVRYWRRSVSEQAGTPLTQLTLFGMRMVVGSRRMLAGDGHARLAALEELLSHDAYEPVRGRVALWAEVVAILAAEPALRTTLQVPAGAEDGTLREPGVAHGRDEEVMNTLRQVDDVIAEMHGSRIARSDRAILVRLQRIERLLIALHPEDDELMLLGTRFAALCRVLMRLHRHRAMPTREALSAITQPITRISGWCNEAPLWGFVDEFYEKEYTQPLETIDDLEELMLMQLMKVCCLGAAESTNECLKYVQSAFWECYPDNSFPGTRSHDAADDSGSEGESDSDAHTDPAPSGSYFGALNKIMQVDWQHPHLRAAVARAVDKNKFWRTARYSLEDELVDELDTQIEHILCERWNEAHRAHRLPWREVIAELVWMPGRGVEYMALAASTLVGQPSAAAPPGTPLPSAPPSPPAAPAPPAEAHGFVDGAAAEAPSGSAPC